MKNQFFIMLIFVTNLKITKQKQG